MAEERVTRGAARVQSQEGVDPNTRRPYTDLGFPGSAATIPPMAPGRTAGRRSQQERRSEAEARLLAAAIELLSRKGWVGMTLAEVGEAAGYSRGQATHYFGNKGALLRALTSHLYQSFGEDMQAAPPVPAGLQAVLSYVRVYFERSDRKWTNARAILLLHAEALLENSDTAQVVAEYQREIFIWVVENLRIGVEQGDVRPDVDPTLGAEFVVGAVRGLAQQRLSRGPVENIHGVSDQVVQLIEHAFAADSARDPRR